MSEPSIKLRTAKDTLVSSLFELSKSANQTASSIIDFYNAVGEDEDEKLEAFTTLTEALQKLTSATNQVQVVSSELTNPLEDDKEVIASIASPVKAPARKRAERDPNAPKKPLTVFFAYSAYVRQALREERQKAGLPPLSSTEITQEISKKWKEMSDVEKDKWKQAYNVELQNYHLEKLKYLEDKKNGVAPSQDAPSSAPVPIPDYPYRAHGRINKYESSPSHIELVVTEKEENVDDWAGNPVNFCKPVAKLPNDKRALVKAAVSGKPYFFFGSDSAPHPVQNKAKYEGVCAGVYSQSFAIPYIAQVFEEQNALENLKGFVSDFGISFYEVKDSEVASSDKAILFKKEQVIPQVISDGKDISIIPFKAGDKLSWSVRWEPR